MNEKSGRIGGRASQALVHQAKRQTGIETDTDLIEFALATVALEDNFAEAFKESRGKVDPELKLGLRGGAEFDFDAARRWARFDHQKAPARRGDNELPFVNPDLIGGLGLLLDTCVYIDQMQDRSPQVLDDLIAQRQVNHSTVAIQELMHTVGVLNPSNTRTTSVVAEIGRQIEAMPAATSDLRARYRGPWKSGAAVGYPLSPPGVREDGKLRALQDCALFLQAQKLGLVVLTANVGDYHILLQLIPAGRMLFYRGK